MSSKRMEWSKRIAAWERGGQTRAAFCSARGLSVHTFDHWRRLLRAESGAALRGRGARSDFVPVGVSHAAAETVAEIELPSGIRLRVSPSIDPAQLGALLQAVRSC